MATTKLTWQQVQHRNDAAHIGTRAVSSLHDAIAAHRRGWDINAEEALADAVLHARWAWRLALASKVRPAVAR